MHADSRKSALSLLWTRTKDVLHGALTLHIAFPKLLCFYGEAICMEFVLVIRLCL